MIPFKLLCISGYSEAICLDIFLLFAKPGEFCEESQPDISVLPSEEAYPAILLIHTVLHYSSINNVPPRGSAACLGRLLYSWLDVYFEYSASA